MVHTEQYGLNSSKYRSEQVGSLYLYAMDTLNYVLLVSGALGEQ